MVWKPRKEISHQEIKQFYFLKPVIWGWTEDAFKKDYKSNKKDVSKHLLDIALCGSFSCQCWYLLGSKL